MKKIMVLGFLLLGAAAFCGCCPFICVIDKNKAADQGKAPSKSPTPDGTAKSPKAKP